MAELIQTNVTVTTTPTLIYTSRVGGSQLKIGNEAGKKVYLGNSIVTKDGGITLAANAVETFAMSGACALYAVVSSGTAAITILEY